MAKKKKMALKEKTLEKMKAFVLKEFRESCPMNDLLGPWVLEDLKCAQLFIDAVFSKGKYMVVNAKAQYTLNGAPFHGYRLDTRLEASDGSLIDAEIQNAAEEFPFKRARLNLSALDREALERGDTYNSVRDTLEIVLFDKDPLGRGERLYRIYRVVEGVGEKIPDGQDIYYINGSYKYDGSLLSKVVHDFHTKETEKMYCSALRNRVNYLRREEGEVFMNENLQKYLNSFARKVKEEGREEGREEERNAAIANFKAKGKSFEFVKDGYPGLTREDWDKICVSEKKPEYFGK